MIADPHSNLTTSSHLLDEETEFREPRCKLPRRAAASPVRATPSQNPLPHPLRLTSSTAMSSIRPSSCTTFPTVSTSPHRGSSSVYTGWRGPSALTLSPSPWRQGLHTTPLPHRVLGRVGWGLGGQHRTHKEATGGLDSRCFGELEGQHSCERGRGRSDGAQGSSRGGPRPTCPPGTPLTTLEHSFDIQSFT